MRTWLNGLRYYLIDWFHEFKRLNSKKRRSDYGLWYFTIPFITRKNWQKYYAKRKELLEQAAATYKHYQDYLSKYIEECPNCGQETYMKVGLTSLYRCYTCNDTPKEWR
jgi:hypothetical protein